MVQPVEERLVGRTLEDRLAHKFDDLQLSREDHQADLFDEIAKSIEVLMKAVPRAFQELMEYKEELDKDLDEESRAIEQEASYARDEIQKQAVYQSRGFKAMWDYREVYEEIIMEVMQKYKLIPMRIPAHSTIGGPMQGDPSPPTQQDFENVPPPPGFQQQQPQNVPLPPPPQPQAPPPQEEQKKPKLSFRKKRGQNQPKDFNL